MSRNFRTPALEIQLSENSASEKIQLFRTGTFYHPEHGQFEITPQLLADIKKNYEAKVRGIDIALDYKHDNDDVAAAWFKELILSDDGSALFAKVDWTPKGKKVVEDKEFRYISPEFTFNYADNETLKEYGPTLLGAGLTNRPVIKKMEPVIDLAEGKIKNLKPGEDAMTLEELTKEVEALKAKNKELSEKNQTLESDKTKSEEAKKLADKKAEFAKLMSENKAVAAQEQAYLDGDMVKFISLAQPLKLAEKGKGGSGDGAQDDVEITKENVEGKIHALATVKLSEKKAKTLGEAYHQVLLENKKLSDVRNSI